MEAHKLSSEDSDIIHHHIDQEESEILKNELGSKLDVVKEKRSPKKSGDKSISPLKQELSISVDDVDDYS